MITIINLMKFSEMRELSRMSFRNYEKIESILKKDFTTLTKDEFFQLCETSIFDHAFLDHFISDMNQRFLTKIVKQ